MMDTRSFFGLLNTALTYLNILVLFSEMKIAIKIATAIQGSKISTYTVNLLKNGHS